MVHTLLRKTISAFISAVIAILTISGGTITAQKGGMDAAPIIITNPNTLYFDDTYLASSSQKTLTIFNAGDADLIITQGIFEGPFETYNSFPITIAPGNTWNQVIHFKPFELGMIEGTVTYVSNDPVTPNKVVNLIGNCINDPINGWEWIYTGYNYINMDIEFPEGQDQIGYIAGQNNTMNGIGIILKTLDGGDTWNQVSDPGIQGLTNCCFPTLETGYAVGWDNSVLKTTDGGDTWTEIVVSTSIYNIHSIDFKDEMNGVIAGMYNSGITFAYATGDGGSTWTEGTGNLVWEDLCYAGDNTYFTAGYEYVCKSTDGGLTWETVFDDGGLLTAIDFYDKDFGMAAGDYGQVITTWDGGATWEQDIIMDRLFHNPFIWDYDTAYVVGTPEYVYKTTDAGETWLSDFNGNWMKAFYQITFTDNYTGFISASGGIVCRKKPSGLVAPEISASPNPLSFSDTNIGETSEETLSIENTGDAALEVTDITSTHTAFSVQLTSFTLEPGETQDVTVYFEPEIAGFTEGTLQVANNSSVNPYEVGVSGTGIAPGPAPVIILNPGTLYFDDTYIASRTQKTLTIFNAGDADLVISEGIFEGPFETYGSFPITVAPGTAWNQVIQFKPFELGLIEGSVTYLSNDPVNPSMTANLIGTCIDDPINGWEWIYTGYNYILTDIEFPEGQDQTGYTGGQTVTYNGLGIMLKTTDGGDTWTPITEPYIAGVERFSFPTLETGYAAGWADDIMKTTDGGQTWESLSVVSNVFYYTAIEFKDENTGILIVNMSSGDPKTLYTSDGGSTWTEGTGNEAFMDVTWAGGDTWYSTGQSNVCKSTDNGATWTTVYTQGGLLVGADFLTPDYGIAAGDYGQVVTTWDGGQSWETDQILDILFSKPFIWDQDTAYVVGTPEYIYKTTDAGQNWISDFDGNWEKALYACTFTDNYTGFVCGGSNGIVLRKKPGQGVVLNPPLNLEAVVNGNEVALNWEAPQGKNLTGYNIYLDNEKINASPVIATSFTDQDVPAGSHFYHVTAVYTQGESVFSNPAEVFIEGALGKILGFIRDAETNIAVTEATITASNVENGDIASYTPFGSHYTMWLVPGTYDVSCSSPGYQTLTAYGLEVYENQNTNQTFYLMPADEDILTGIINMSGLADISVFPNPATDRITIEGSDLQKVLLYNQLGEQIRQSGLNAGSIVFYVGDLKPGIYMLRMVTESAIITRQVIIK